MSLRFLSVCMLFISVDAVALEKIELENGDEITVEILEVTMDKVVIQHPELGVITVARNKIKSDLKHKLTPGLFGTSFLEGWNRRIDLGANGSQGTSISRNFTAGLDFSYKDKEKQWTVTGRYSFQGDEEGTTENQGRLSLQRNWLLPDSSWFWFGALGYQYDQFESWKHRTVVAAGPGYHLLKRKKHTLDVRGGPAYVREFGKRTTNKADLLAAFDYTWKPRDRMTITLSNQFFVEGAPDAGQIRNMTFANWRTRILSEPSLDLIFGVENQYQSQNEDGDKPNTLNYYITLGMNF